MCHWQEPKRQRFGGWTGFSVFDVRKRKQRGFVFGGKQRKELRIPSKIVNFFFFLVMLNRQRLGEGMKDLGLSKLADNSGPLGFYSLKDDSILLA